MPRATVTPQSSEVHAYVFIRDNLKAMGWDTRNPARHPEGQVYTQAECLAHPEIKKQLGLDKPENVVKLSESAFWVIEAKRSHTQIGQAVGEAEKYARKINRSNVIAAPFISGLAGNETDGYLVQTLYLDGAQFKPITINGKQTSALISPEIVRIVLKSGPDIADVPVDEALFLSQAERINAILHLGAINKNHRARVMAALLLSLVEDTPPNIDAAPSVLIGDINSRANRVLRSQGKPEFYPYIELSLPATEDNHLKFKTALVQTLQELNNLNIRSAMNSGTDVLGKFYEVFLKYGNGAKEIGIVLTPRHITRFAADVLSITDRDVVYDPACGTGGFLVSAFDAIRQSYGEVQVNRFKQNNLFGVEQEPEVVALAIVNMIFRGDGKNNIMEGNCFQRRLVRTVRGNVVTAEYARESAEVGEQAVTRVMMNPPFALKGSDEKEFRFVEHALKQMQDGGLLFSVMPYSAMVKPYAYKRWRERLLKANTLLSVITFPVDLFYPIGVHTVGLFVKKGIPHPIQQNVLWIRALNDGLLKSKGKRLPSPRAPDDFAQIRGLVRAFLSDPDYPVPALPQFQQLLPVDFDDPLLELVPENYLEHRPPTDDELRNGIDQVIRDAVAYMIHAGLEDGQAVSGTPG
jgi:type I restriction enzyme M protein